MENDVKIKRMKELVELLGRASRAYYAEDSEILSNLEYDRLYDELEGLETETGMTLSGSPTVSVGYEPVEELPKEQHEKPMLSLGKTKSREELRAWLQGHPALLSWKLDGLTVVMTYRNGKMEKAVTRGNGEVGEVITANASVFLNVPLKIPYQGELVLRGEAVISYSDFEKINEEIPEEGERYKNPRNLCSGSVRQLDSKVTAKRRVRFYAFSLVKAENVDFHDKRSEQFVFLKKQGFDVVEHHLVTEDTILSVIDEFERKITNFDIPSDGLVLALEELSYGKSLGMTAKFPRDSIAFKWMDEKRETILREIEWSPSRTGLINPVAIFDPVELEGTTVSRASVHNLSIMEKLKLGIGDTITVYKANMIIPQIAENLTESGRMEIPDKCPACGGKTEVRAVNDASSLYCTNPDCSAKKIKSYTHFVSRSAMNIEGLSEATLEKFLGKGFIREYADLYHLDRHRDEIVEMEGFGVKSYDNLISGVEKSRNTTLAKLLFSLGISNIGLANAKVICRHFKNDLEKLLTSPAEEISTIEGIGPVIAGAFVEYFDSDTAEGQKRKEEFDRLLTELTLEREDFPEEGQMGNLEGKVFVITGSLEHFENRNVLKDEIEKRGGKVTGSVTSKTTLLINNDATSGSSKNKTAKSLGIPILTEEAFMKEYLQ